MSDKQNSPKWKRYEDLVYEIQKEFAQDAVVKQDDHIMGEESKTLRQIDISIRRTVGQFSLLIVIDCKDYKEPVDVKDVGEFVSMVRDVRANKGALVSSSGFTSSAIEMAKVHGIDTLRHVDTKNVDWKTYAAVPVLLERTFLKGYSFLFTNFESLPSMVSVTSPAYLELENEDGSRIGFVRDVIAKKWNAEEIAHQPGEQEIVVGNGVYIKTATDRYKTNISAKLEIGREYYFGPLPIEARGFYNEQTSAITTRQLITDQLEPYLIETGQVKGWSKIEDPTKLAVQPVFGATYSDQMSLLDGEQLASINQSAH